MSTATEALEACQQHLSDAASHAEFLGVLLRQEAGLSGHMRRVTYRSALTAVLRGAADACETIGVEQNDTRWCGLVTLLAMTGERVWKVQDPAECAQMAELLERLRHRVWQLQRMSVSGGVTVRLAG